MGRMSKEEIARYEGMAYALRIAKKDGIEGLESEIKKRGITGISINMSHKEIEKATENMRNMMFDTFLCFTIGILHDCFGFGKIRANKFKNQFFEGAQFLDDGVLAWNDVIKNTEEVLGMQLHIRENNVDSRLERIY